MGVACGRRERIRSASESVRWEAGPERSRVRSTKRREQLFVADFMQKEMISNIYTAYTTQIYKSYQTHVINSEYYYKSQRHTFLLVLAAGRLVSWLAMNREVQPREKSSSLMSRE